VGNLCAEQSRVFIRKSKGLRRLLKKETIKILFSRDFQYRETAKLMAFLLAF